jgi:inner membrane protease ATP23
MSTSAPDNLPEASSSRVETPAGFDRWRSSLAQFTGLGLTPDEKVERERRLEGQSLERDWNRCEKWKKDLMEGSRSSHYAFTKESRLTVA